MENQPIVNSSETTPINSAPGSQLSIPTQTKTRLLIPILSTVLVSAVVFGSGGYYLGIKQNGVSSKEQKPLETTTPTMQNTTKSTALPTNNASQSKTYDSKFISFDYPTNLFVWSYGRGVSLDYFQLNSIDQNSDQDQNNNVVFSFDIQSLTYTEGQSIADQKIRIEGLQKQYPEDNYTIANRTVDGTPALVYERTIANSPSYEKTVWLIKNNVKYIISMSIPNATLKVRDSLKNKYQPDFESIVNSVRLKYVDPAEVERLGNHPD